MVWQCTTQTQRSISRKQHVPRLASGCLSYLALAGLRYLKHLKVCSRLGSQGRQTPQRGFGSCCSVAGLSCDLFLLVTSADFEAMLACRAERWELGAEARGQLSGVVMPDKHCATLLD